jgi:hypothetical protein
MARLRIFAESAGIILALFGARYLLRPLFDQNPGLRLPVSMIMLVAYGLVVLLTARRFLKVSPPKHASMPREQWIQLTSKGRMLLVVRQTALLLPIGIVLWVAISGALGLVFGGPQEAWESAAINLLSTMPMIVIIGAVSALIRLAQADAYWGNSGTRQPALPPTHS